MHIKFANLESDLCGRVSRRSGCGSQDGFSILEMVLASAILMVGIISVVQLVPASLQLNSNNRLDTIATTIAQRELDQMLAQPLTVDTFTDQSGNAISLGGANLPGAPVITDPQTLMAQIDFGANTVNGFSLSYVDPNGATFDVRWAVFPQVSGTRTISRRIIIGCRQTNARQLFLPITLDSSVQK
jgi:hypothetical protein